MGEFDTSGDRALQFDEFVRMVCSDGVATRMTQEVKEACLETIEEEMAEKAKAGQDIWVKRRKRGKALQATLVLRVQAQLSSPSRAPAYQPGRHLADAHASDAPRR